VSTVRVALMVLAVTVIAGCGDYEVPLRHGYILGRISSGTFVVVDPSHHVVVGPTVNGCKIVGDRSSAVCLVTTVSRATSSSTCVAGTFSVV
jgi:hypothetical protein